MAKVGSSRWNRCVYGYEHWVVVGSTPGDIQVSTDAVNWSGASATNGSLSQGEWTSVTYCEQTQQFWAVGQGSYDVAYSDDDGLTWTLLQAGFERYLFNDVACGNGVIMGASEGGSVVRSLDNGKSWAQCWLGRGDGTPFDAIAYGNGTWVATCNGRGTWYSIDNGDNWQLCGYDSLSGDSAFGMSRITYGGGKFVGGHLFRTYESNDGITFRGKVNGFGAGQIIWDGKNYFTVVGSTIIYGTDAATGDAWPGFIPTDINGTENKSSLFGICYGPNIPAHVLVVLLSSMTFAYTGETKQNIVIATTNGNAVDFNIDSHPDWLSVEKVIGSDAPIAISVTAEPNDTAEDKAGEIVVSHSALPSLTRTISVTSLTKPDAVMIEEAGSGITLSVDSYPHTCGDGENITGRIAFTRQGYIKFSAPVEGWDSVTGSTFTPELTIDPDDNTKLLIREDTWSKDTLLTNTNSRVRINNLRFEGMEQAVSFDLTIYYDNSLPDMVLWLDNNDSQINVNPIGCFINSTSWRYDCTTTPIKVREFPVNGTWDFVFPAYSNVFASSTGVTQMAEYREGGGAAMISWLFYYRLLNATTFRYNGNMYQAVTLACNSKTVPQTPSGSGVVNTSFYVEYDTMANYPYHKRVRATIALSVDFN